MDIITVAQIKTYLGISDSTYDTQLTAILPALNAKVKQITGRSLSNRVSLVTTADETTAYVYPVSYGDLIDHKRVNVGNPVSMNLLADFVVPGQQVESDNLSSGTTISDVYPRDYLKETGSTNNYLQITLSAVATTSGTTIATIGANIAYHPTIAKLAWWMVSDQSTATPSGSVASKSLGDISVSYSTAGADLDGRYGVPAWAVRALPRYGRGY